MKHTSESILLIVPCFNEQSRIKVEDYLHLPGHLNILFANDGSVDETKKILEKICEQNSSCSIYDSKENVGKACVIFKAFQFAKLNDLVNRFDWVGYWDADLASPLEEVINMLNYEKFNKQRFDAIWGSRVYRLGSDIKRSRFRHYLGRVFVTITSSLLNVRAYDTQCGAKVFRLDCAKEVFREPFVSNWIFDIEIYLRSVDQGFKILEYPLMKWHNMPGSKVKIIKEFFRVGRDILRIKKLYKR